MYEKGLFAYIAKIWIFFIFYQNSFLNKTKIYNCFFLGT